MIPDCLKAMWAEGPGGGHYEAMSSRSTRRSRAGSALRPTVQIWAVQNFH